MDVNNSIKYNEDTDMLDVYYNGIVVGSLVCGFQWNGNILEESTSIWSIARSGSCNPEISTGTNGAMIITYNNLDNSGTYNITITSTKSFNLTNKKILNIVSNIKSHHIPASNTPLEVYLINKETSIKYLVCTAGIGSSSYGWFINTVELSADITEYTGEYYIKLYIAGSHGTQYPGSQTITTFEFN